MADPGYAEVWKQHQARMHDQQLAAAEQKMARADHDLAKQNLDAGAPEQRPDLEKKFFDTQAVLEQKTDKYVEAQTAVAQLQLQHPDHAAALEQNIPPKEASPSLMDQAKGAVQIAGVVAQSFSPEMPALPSAEQMVTNPPVHREVPLLRRPEEEGRQIQEAYKQGSQQNENLDKAVGDASRPGATPGEPKGESTTIAAQGSASFGAQAFGSGPEPFPNRSPANDNDPPNKGGAPAVAQPAPANDNQKPADAVAAQPAVSSRVAADFGAPLPPPPPPPPPPPLEQESRMAR